MFYALDSDGARKEATPKGIAVCPSCGTSVRAKCGRLVSWHWAHVEAECDPWTEPMTEWHRSWQAEFPEVCREFIVPIRETRHRADVLAPIGTVIEFQHSSISPEEIAARESFYPRMVWVFDIRDAYQAKFDNETGVWYGARRLSLRRKRADGYVTFRWKHARKTIATCHTPVYLDLDGEHLLRLGRIHLGPPCGGWGHVVSRKQFVATMTGVEVTT